MTAHEVGEWSKKQLEQIQRQMPANVWRGLGITAIALGILATATGYTNNKPRSPEAKDSN